MKFAVKFKIRPKSNVEIKFIPPRLTNLLQPAVVCWFRSIKAQFSERWCEWYINSANHTYTAFNNLRSPPYATVIRWISEIWRDFDSVLLAESFEKCEITSSSNLHHILNKFLHERILLEDYVDEITIAERRYSHGFNDGLATSEDSSDI